MVLPGLKAIWTYAELTLTDEETGFKMEFHSKMTVAEITIILSAYLRRMELLK